MPKKVSTDTLKYNNEKFLSNIGDGIVEFTSEDATNATSFTSMDTLKSGLTLSNLFNKVSTMFKNIRYLYSMVNTLDSDLTASGGLIYLKNGTGPAASAEHFGYVFKLTKNVGYFTMTTTQYGYKTIAAGSTVVAATLPSGFYPEREVTIAVSPIGYNASLCGWVRTNGEIVISNPSSSAISYWRAFGVYYLP